MAQKKKTEPVQGYKFSSEGDPRNGTICKIVSRVEEEGSLLEQGPMFEIKFGDGETMTASGYELSPWFPTE